MMKNIVGRYSISHMKFDFLRTCTKINCNVLCLRIWFIYTRYMNKQGLAICGCKGRVVNKLTHISG